MAADAGQTSNLDGIENLDNTGVPQGAQFLEGVLGQREAGPVGSDVEGEDAAVGAVFLEVAAWSAQQMVDVRWDTAHGKPHTFLVPLYSVQMDSSTSTRSPKE